MTQSPLDTVIELAEQNVLSKGEAKLNELEDERERQLEALKAVKSFQDHAQETLESVPSPPEERDDVDSASLRALRGYDEARSTAHHDICDTLKSIL